ncbi:HTH domain-containing protein [Vibrio atlanticus]|uniref:HTH domain-containing protein n=1 Tax=Vibrio atlanticus TaxID=693153 RepID=UPI0035534356
MNIDWAVFRKNLKFLIALIKPSLAKALSVPLLMAGIGILNAPLWLDIANWFLTSQEVLPEFRGPISPPKDLYGWILISLSLLIYLIEIWFQFKSLRQDSEKKLLDTVEEHPAQTAGLVVETLRSTGFTAQHLQDEKIDKLIDEITLLRFFNSYPTEEKAINLAESIIDGELSGGTPKVKARALALLARYVSVGEKVKQAKEWLSASKRLCQVEEAQIAQVFIGGTRSNNTNAVSNLLEVGGASSYSAFFIIKSIAEGSEIALGWFDSSGLSANELDSDGKIALVSALLSEHQWKKALNVVEALELESISKSPALAQVSAITFLGNAIKAVELRESIMNTVPFAADKFPLADDSESIALRNRSIELFSICSKLAKELGALDIANVSDKYVLWLELRSSEMHEQAMVRLQSYFVNYTQNTLEYLPLAFVFGIDIDFESIENEVDKQTALSHENDPIIGFSRFIVAQTKKPFTAVVEYIANHRAQIERAVSSITIDMIEIEALAKSGLVDDAEDLLQKIASSGVPDTEVRNLQNIIDTAKGEDPVALAISQYQESKATSDLYHLVSLLEKGTYRDKHYLYSRELFECTGQESDAIRFCNAASSLGQFPELHQFLSDRMDLVNKSDRLRLHWAWSLFRKGDLIGSREQIELLKLSKSQQLDIKTLEVNLSIFSGDWESLSVFVEDSWISRENLKADELIQAAQLAKAFSPSRAKQILEFCTGKFPEDPQVLASSYFAATTMGWEDSQETSEWLNKAITLSDEDGPLRRTSLEDLKGIMSEAREKNERVNRAYVDGDAPIYTVADLLNRTMSDFFLVQPLENKKAIDLRRKNLVPIFHGARHEKVIEGETIAIDVSSALVMENIGLLDQLFDCFERVVVPHSFLRWLFEEKQKVSFHQPSQIEKAKYFERLVSDGRISVFHPKKINNPELALDVGDELACMLEEVYANPTNESQALVVCSCPVYKVGGSFREVEVDLSLYHQCMISCSQLIKKLKSIAVITEAQCRKALSYLRQHEKEWPTELEVEYGAKLFLDSLSITYLMTIGMLDKLNEAGFEVYVYTGERDKYRLLMNYDSTINQVDSKIEDIRKLFFNGLASGKVFLAEMPLHKEEVVDSKNKHATPTEELFEMVKVCDAALIDDRFMNRHDRIAFDSSAVPIFTTLDFVETLYHKEFISKEQKLDSRTLLRDLGYEFVSISSEELEHHLDCSAIVDGEFKPTKQLKLIRENLLLIRISGLVQLPRDAEWLLENLRTISKAIGNQWSIDISLEQARARASWLYGLRGTREWAQTHQVRDDGGMAYLGAVLKVNSLLIPPESLSEERKEDYKAWLDEFVLDPLRDTDPLSFKNVIDSMKQQVKSISHQSILEDELNG